MRWNCAIPVVISLHTASVGLTQEDALTFVVSNDISPARPSATVTLYAGYDPGGYAQAFAFAGAGLEVGASEPGWSSQQTLPGGSGPGSDGGALAPGGARVEGLNVNQIHFPPGGVFADPTNPLPVWQATFEVTDFSARSIDIFTETSDYFVYTDLYPSRQSRLDTLIEGAGVIRVIPAPGASA
ncbi:MAG: hypothetical protein ACF8R7_00305, partial [Phycisphaerales bacterium JB039]